MQGVPAIYLGKIVDKKHFRTFIYAPTGMQKLVESWDEYEKHMETGLWFATADEAKESIIVEEKPKPARVRNKATKVSFDAPMVEVLESAVVPVDEPLIEEALIPVDAEVIDVKDDDFLPKESK